MSVVGAESRVGEIVWAQIEKGRWWPGVRIRVSNKVSSWEGVYLFGRRECVQNCQLKKWEVGLCDNSTLTGAGLTPQFQEAMKQVIQFLASGNLTTKSELPPVQLPTPAHPPHTPPPVLPRPESTAQCTSTPESKAQCTSPPKPQPSESSSSNSTRQQASVQSKEVAVDRKPECASTQGASEACTEVGRKMENKVTRKRGLDGGVQEQPAKQRKLVEPMQLPTKVRTVKECDEVAVRRMVEELTGHSGETRLGECTSNTPSPTPSNPVSHSNSKNAVVHCEKKSTGNSNNSGGGLCNRLQVLPGQPMVLQDLFHYLYMAHAKGDVGGGTARNG